MSSVTKLCSVPPWYCSSIIPLPSTPSPYPDGRVMRALAAILPPSPAPPPMPNSPPSTLRIIGAVIGSVAVLIVAILVCLYCRKMKKSRQQVNLTQNSELLASPGTDKGDLYARTYQEPQHPPPAYHVIKLSSETDLHPIPTQTIPMKLNDGDSGSAYSGSEPRPPYSPVTLGMLTSTFTYNELVIATEGFSGTNFLGEGGFGYVHKGILTNGMEVAVKQLKTGSRQGEREFRAEVEIISRVHHKHLVSLVGYCISNDHRLLVYEFLPNGTLEFHLHAQGRPTLEWPTRLKIALGSAKGLAYLHEDCHPKIIHRDIKSANILLDYMFEAKVADFGLAKLTEDNKSHVSTRVMGTFGYLAPEYASSGKITEKSDVFSFGVMLLELITGRRPVDMTQSSANDSLVDWARPLLMHATKHGNYEQLVDPTLGKNYKENGMARMIICAAACVLNSAKFRPSMSQVVHALEGNTSIDDLIKGLKQSQRQYISSYSKAMIREFREIAQQSNQYQSSQYPSSEDHEMLEIEMGSDKEQGHLRNAGDSDADEQRTGTSTNSTMKGVE